MFRPILLPIVCITALGATAAVAADLDGKSRNQREIYCVANGFIDIAARRHAGFMSDQEYNRVRNQLSWENQEKGDVSIRLLAGRTKKRSEPLRFYRNVWHREIAVYGVIS